MALSKTIMLKTVIFTYNLAFYNYNFWLLPARTTPIQNSHPLSYLYTTYQLGDPNNKIIDLPIKSDGGYGPVEDLEI